jgi:(p)ppGpp synthase/HD superfamily hydrolase
MVMALLTERFQDALVYAAQLHATQKRKGTEIPYVAHLLGVAALVIEAGGDEDEAIAALLHDAVEDQGGAHTRETIRRRFGDRVTRIVDGCTDTDIVPKPPWRERKEQYIAHVLHAPADVRRVSVADKLHNARSIIADLRRDGPSTFERFKGGRDGTLWYYRALLEAYQAAGADPLVDELARVVGEMEQLLSPTHAGTCG